MIILFEKLLSQTKCDWIKDLCTTSSKNGAKVAIKICKILFKICCTNPFLKLANCFITEQTLIWQFLGGKMISVAFFSIILLNQINQDSGLSSWTFFYYSQLKTHPPSLKSCFNLDVRNRKSVSVLLALRFHQTLIYFADHSRSGPEKHKTKGIRKDPPLESCCNLNVSDMKTQVPFLRRGKTFKIRGTQPLGALSKYQLL